MSAYFIFRNSEYLNARIYNILNVLLVLEPCYCSDKTLYSAVVLIVCLFIFRLLHNSSCFFLCRYFLEKPWST